MRGSETDLLFRVPFLAEEAFLYLLFEHQSTPDRDLPLPLPLPRYVVRIWEHFRSGAGPGPLLPPVVPVVLYQGTASWPQGQSLADIVAFAGDPGGALRAFVPDFRFALIDLRSTPAGKVGGELVDATFLRLMKAARENELLAFLQANLDALSALADLRDGLALVETLFRYVLHVDSTIDSRALVVTLETITNPKVKETAMSVADQLIQQGIEQGAQKAGAAHLARLESLLGIDASPAGQLEALSPDELDRRIRAPEEELRRRLG